MLSELFSVNAYKIIPKCNLKLMEFEIQLMVNFNLVMVGVFYMSMSSRKSSFNLTHQQSDVLDYITEIAQELAQMADRVGCSRLGHDLRQALLIAHGIEAPSSEGIVPSHGREG